MKEEYKLSEESAQEQLDLLFNFYDVDLSIMDEEDKLKNSIERKLIKAIRLGRLEVENNSEGFFVKQNLRDGTQFIYRELTGMAKVQMDRFKGQHEKLYGLLGMLSKKPIEQIQKISGFDLTVAEYLALIFLAG